MDNELSNLETLILVKKFYRYINNFFIIIIIILKWYCINKKYTKCILNYQRKNTLKLNSPSNYDEKCYYIRVILN